ncbi:MAG TPA: rhodanese-like domain-containing protein, partial [Dokdonella sp.]
MSDVLHRLPEFLGNHFYLTLGFFAVLVALLVTEAQRFTRGYTALTPAGLTQLINRENALLIDVSSLQDFEKGHIPGAKHVAMSQFDPESKDLAKVRERPVAVVCRSGQTSA